MIMKRIALTLMLLALAAVALATPKQYTVLSPSGKLSLAVTVGDGITYTLSHGQTVLLQDSGISMTFTDGTVFGSGDKVRKVVRRSVDQTLVPVVYKKAEVRDNFNEMTLKFKNFDLIFRAYDAGVAYRFASTMTGAREVRKEQADFAFPGDWTGYIPSVRDFDDKDFTRQYWNSFENIYVHYPISQWDKRRLAFLPLVVEEPSGLKVCITESDLVDYPGMYLYNGDGDNVLTSDYAPYPKKVDQAGHNMLQGVVRSREDYIAKVDGPTSFPWRIAVVSESDKELTDNDLVWLLGAPYDPAADYSWIKPGKVAWDWWNDWNLYGVDFKAGINNDTYKYYIDFASKYGIEYVILDEGWAVNLQADLMQVIPEIDLPMLSKYAQERGVGLVLWAGYWAFNRDMEGVCKHYSEMGIKGFKVDFMDRDDQEMVRFYRQAAETAAKYHLFVDFHGAFKPSGLHRTYPNVLNYEGVHGLEQLKWGVFDPATGAFDQVKYETIIPFIRMLAGPMDYTQGAMRNGSFASYRSVNSEGMSQGTRCRQLAEYVIFESPFNMLCDSPSNYLREPECTRFIADCPTVWDETVAIDGKIGDYVAIARRKGDKWYVGAITDWNGRDMVLDLGGILGGGSWKMEVFKDGLNADKAARDFKHETLAVPSDGRVNIHMASGGGWTAIISRN